MLAALVHLDHLARAWVVTHRMATLNGLLWGLSAVGRGGLVFAAMALALTVARRRARDFVRVGLALILASVVTDYILKPAVNRQRPFLSTPAIDVIGGRPRDASFPSGHSANAFAGALALNSVAPGGAVVWWGLACAIAYSRVYLGVHYPADVVGGALIGLLTAAGARAIHEWIIARAPST